MLRAVIRTGLRPGETTGVFADGRGRLSLGLVLTIVVVAFEGLAVATIMPITALALRGLALVLEWRDDASEGDAQANAFLPSEARGGSRIARDIGGSRPDVAYANSRHRHRIPRPQ